jgi:hypothetical protein
LYDGSAQAREILSDAMGAIFDHPEGKDWHAFGILGNALDYLKGRDMQDLFSYTADFFGPTPEEWIEQMAEEAEPEKPTLVQIKEFEASDTVFDPELLADSQLDYIRPATADEVAEDYPEWNPNSEPKNPA